MTLPNYIQDEVDDQKAKQTEPVDQERQQKLNERLNSVQHLKNKQRVPEGMKLYTNTEIEHGYHARDGQRLIPPEWGKAMIRQMYNPNKSYFAQDPKRLAKYKAFLDAAPEGWEPPEWLNPDAITNAYDFMTEIQESGANWEEWKPLDVDDPSAPYLNMLPDPPKDFQLGYEKDYGKEFLQKFNVNKEAPPKHISAYGESEYGDYESLEPWEKMIASLVGNVPEDAPEHQKKINAVMKGLMAAGAGRQLTGMVMKGLLMAGVGGTAGTAVLPGVGTALGVVAGLGLGFASYQQAMTGKKIPVLNEILMVADIADEGLERILGTTYQMIDADEDERMEILRNIPETWKASQLFYESLPIGNWLTNAISETAYASELGLGVLGIDVEFGSGIKAKPGEVWMIQKGFAEPVALRGGVLAGAALDEARMRLINGELPEIVYADYLDRFGYGGSLGDFVAQSVTPGDALMPRGVNVMGEFAGKVFGDPRLEAAFKVNKGSRIVDALPWGAKELVAVSTGAKTSGGLFDALGTYRDYVRHGYYPKGTLPFTTVDVDVPVEQAYPGMIDEIEIELREAQSLDAVKETIKNKLTSKQVDISNERIQDVIDRTSNEIFEEISKTDQAKDVTANMISEKLKDRINYIGAYTKQIKRFEIPELKRWQKVLGGVSDEGRIAELEAWKPDPEAPAWKNAFRYLVELDPQSKAFAVENLLHNNLGAIFQMADTPETMMKLVEAVANQDVTQIGNASEALLKSPVGATIASAVKAYMRDGTSKEKFAIYSASKMTQAKLYKIAELLGEKPGRIIELMNTPEGFDGLTTRMLNVKDQMMGTVLENIALQMENENWSAYHLQDAFEIYRKDHPVAWSDEQFKTEVVLDMTSKATEFLIEHYGIKPDPWFIKASKALKSFQSLTLLGLNPQYLINKTLNTTVNLTAQGVLGTMTSTQLSSFWERWGVTPDKAIGGLGAAKGSKISMLKKRSQHVFETPEGEVSGAEMNEYFRDSQKVGKAEKAYQISRKLNKLGIFANISKDLQRNAGIQATTVGTMQMWHTLWKPGLGFEKLPRQVETALNAINPNITDMIYSIAASGMNVDEIVTNLYKTRKIMGIRGYAEKMANKMYKKAPGLMMEMIVKTGILDDLNVRLENSTTVKDVDMVFSNTIDALEHYIDEAWDRDVEIRREDVRNKVKTENIYGAVPVWNEVTDMYEQQRYTDMRENQATAEMVANLKNQIAEAKEAGQDRLVSSLYDRINVLWEARVAEQTRQWDRLNKWSEESYKGMLDALDPDDPNNTRFIAAIQELNDNWKKFYEDKQEIIKGGYVVRQVNTEATQQTQSETLARIDEYANSLSDTQREAASMGLEPQPERTEQDGNVYDFTEGYSGQEVIDSVTELYKIHTAREIEIHTEMWDALAEFQKNQSDVDTTAMVQWGRNIMEVRKRMVEAIIQHRESLSGTPDEQLAQWMDFNDNTLTPLIAQRIHYTTEGAKRVFAQTGEHDGVRAPATGTPTDMFNGVLYDEVYKAKLYPYLRGMKKMIQTDMETNPEFKLADLDQSLIREIQAWSDKLPEAMAGTKIAAQNHGEFQRNRAMLDYNQRYGFDNYLEILFPYQFWFTRSIAEWGKKMIDRPSWFAMYARIQKLQERMGKDERIPERFEGQMRVAAPWLPDWMGNSMFVDPFKRIFPFTQFSQPFEQADMTFASIQRTAQGKIFEMAESGEFDMDEAKEIIEAKEGAYWEQAMAEAQAEVSQDELAPMNLTSMMVTPAMWWTYPYNLIKGTPEDIPLLPTTRLGQSIRGVGGDGLIGLIGNVLATPEEAIRRKFNLPIYGKWGDYYLDRTISNMAGDGTYSVEQVRMALIERKGEVYEEGVRRVEEELALRMPGSQTAMAIKEGRYGAIARTLLTTLFPAGIISEGELALAGLKDSHAAAWEAYTSGQDLNAVNNWYEENPEYKARTALFDKPEERLRKFLQDGIWDKYYALPEDQRYELADVLGTQFEQQFLSDQDYDKIDTETLAYWSRSFGNEIPDAGDASEVANMPDYMMPQETYGLQPQPQTTQPEAMQSPDFMQTYEQERDAKFPDYKILQDTYWSLPEEQRPAFLKSNPMLKNYWDWNKAYKNAVPAVNRYIEERNKQFDELDSYAQQYSESMDPSLRMSMMFSYFSGKDVTGSAKAILMTDWENLGEPGDDFEEWLNRLLKGLLE